VSEGTRLQERLERLQKERDFYRAQCDDLGARVLRLQEEQARAHRDARRWQTTARIISESYRSINVDGSLEKASLRILATILDNIMCDRAALLRAGTDNDFHLTQAVGYWGHSPPERRHLSAPPEFACVSAHAPPSRDTDELHAIIGLPHFLWYFHRASGYALILGRRSEGKVARPFEAADRAIMEGILGIVVDLEEKLRLRNEREVLVEELQHRVRNNLQVVYGMLSNELDRRNDRHAPGLEAIARRVLTMAEVYDHLLGRGMSRIVDFGCYLSDLCASLAELQGARFADVALSCEVEPVYVDLDAVMSIGLAVAELIANSYEHAFPSRQGSIAVSLHPVASAPRAIVTIRDDGPGFTANGGNQRHGLGLVKRLVAQAHGTIENRVERGTVWTIELPTVSPHLLV
jgi:two-component sensor histidine kinase